MVMGINVLNKNARIRLIKFVKRLNEKFRLPVDNYLEGIICDFGGHLLEVLDDFSYNKNSSSYLILFLN